MNISSDELRMNAFHIRPSLKPLNLWSEAWNTNLDASVVFPIPPGYYGCNAWQLKVYSSYKPCNIISSLLMHFFLSWPLENIFSTIPNITTATPQRKTWQSFVE